MLDILIINGHIIDGMGNPHFRANIGIKDGVIQEIGKITSEADTVIDAKGLIVSPGFIDIHTHSDLTLLANPKAESKIRQGVTTEVIGNCGFSAAPIRKASLEHIKKFLEFLKLGAEINWDWFSFADYLNKLEKSMPAVNVAPLVGHGTIRVNVMGFENRQPTNSELEEMKELLSNAMKDGAFGLSSGLGYAPACYADTSELIELCKIVAKYGGIYATHIRDEADGIIEAAMEAIQIGERAGLPVEISHYKPEGRKNWGKVGECIQIIENAQKRGVNVTYDVYPYIAGEAPITHVCFIPPWVQEGGIEQTIERLKNPQVREKIKIEAKEKGWKECLLNIATWDDILISFSKREKNLQGKKLSEIADLKGMEPYDVLFDLLIKEKGAVNMCVFVMNEDTISAMIKNRFGMIGSDGMSVSPYGVFSRTRPHPRYYGTFPRFLGKYVRQDNILTLEEAIRKITSMPAQKLGLRNRGLIKEGFYADIVIFDSKTVIDKATFFDPHQYPEGIKYVLVNGKIIVEDGKHTEVRAGKVLRKSYALGCGS
jgi:N-acyl-D-amino-acid deacylase